MAERDDWALQEMRARSKKAEADALAAAPAGSPAAGGAGQAPRAAAAPAGAPPAPGAATSAPSARPSTGTPPGTITVNEMSLRGLVGIILVVVGIVGLVLYSTVPVVQTDPDSDVNGKSLERDDWAKQMRGFRFLKDAIDGPFASYIMLIVVGVLLVGLDVAPIPRLVRHGAHAVLLGGAGFFAYFIVLDSARLFGVYFAELLRDGPTAIHLHVGAYLDAAIGCALIALVFWALATLRRDLKMQRVAPERRYAFRAPLVLLLVALSGIALTALVPLGSYGGEEPSDSDALWLTFGTLDRFGFLSEDLADAGDHFETAENLLWAVAWMAAVSVLVLVVEAVGWFPKVFRGIAQVLALAGIPLLIGVIFLILAYVALWTADDMGPIVNYVPMLGYAGAVALYVRFLMMDTIPYVRSLDIQVARAPEQPGPQG